jgi:hypothetical protein
MRYVCRYTWVCAGTITPQCTVNCASLKCAHDGECRTDWSHEQLIPKCECSRTTYDGTSCDTDVALKFTNASVLMFSLSEALHRMPMGVRGETLSFAFATDRLGVTLVHARCARTCVQAHARAQLDTASVRAGRSECWWPTERDIHARSKRTSLFIQRTCRRLCAARCAHHNSTQSIVHFRECTTHTHTHIRARTVGQQYDNGSIGKR